MFASSAYGTYNFVADWDDDSTSETIGWWFNGSDQVAELEQNGDLRIGGTLSTNAFDVAESYRQAEPVAAGDLVRVAPGDPTAIEKASADEPGVLGVVSTEPGILLGGAPGSVAELERAWGPEAVAEYQAQRPTLREHVRSEHPSLSERIAAADGDERTRLQQTFERLTLERFAEDYLAPVALSGRVPTAAATTNGPIEPGDTLTVSASPGVAELADPGDPVIGKALEGLSTGTGEITVFVSPGSASADVSELEAAVDEQQETIDELEAENEALRERLDDIEQRLEDLEAEHGG